MSLQLVNDFAENLPYRLKEDVISYARSVQTALPDIFREAGLAQDAVIGNQLVLIAGVKKLFAICSSTFWILDNSLESLNNAETYEVRIGPTRISKGSRQWRQLRDLLSDLEDILMAQEMQEALQSTSYSEIARWLRNGR